jgi:hypothetical protein
MTEVYILDEKHLNITLFTVKHLSTHYISSIYSSKTKFKYQVKLVIYGEASD